MYRPDNYDPADPAESDCDDDDKKDDGKNDYDNTHDSDDEGVDAK